MKPSDILEKYRDEVAALKPFKYLNEQTATSKHLRLMTAVEDKETFKELEATMDIENLTIKGEVQPMQVNSQGMGNYGIGVPKFFQSKMPEVAAQSLKTCFMQNKWLGISQGCRKLRGKRRRNHFEDNDHWWQSQPKLPKNLNHNVTDREKLYCIRVYRPFVHIGQNVGSTKDISYSQEIWMLGHHNLADLRDTIACPADFHCVGVQVDTIKTPAQRAIDVYRSGFFYINGTFYNDTRNKMNIDYSQTIIDWASSTDRCIGPFEKACMETTVLDDLKLRIGCPYLYTHQGNHEHLIVFYDVRLVGSEDPQNTARYPLTRSLGQQFSKTCMVCQVDIATWVVTNSDRLADNPCFFCTVCYKDFNLKANGEKEGNFDAFKYLDVNAI